MLIGAGSLSSYQIIKSYCILIHAVSPNGGPPTGSGFAPLIFRLFLIPIKNACLNLFCQQIYRVNTIDTKLECRQSYEDPVAPSARSCPNLPQCISKIIQSLFFLNPVYPNIGLQSVRVKKKTCEGPQESPNAFRLSQFASTNCFFVNALPENT